jgi:hypothetical protein
VCQNLQTKLSFKFKLLQFSSVPTSPGFETLPLQAHSPLLFGGRHFLDILQDLEVTSPNAKETLYSVCMNAIFWDLALCESCYDRHFGGTYCLHH